MGDLQGRNLRLFGVLYRYLKPYASHLQGWSPDLAQLVVKPASGSLARGVTPVKGVSAAAAAAAALSAAAASILVEPFMKSGVQFSCVVVEGEDGPVALMPAEVELYDVEREIFRCGLRV